MSKMGQAADAVDERAHAREPAEPAQRTEDLVGFADAPGLSGGDVTRAIVNAAVHGAGLVKRNALTIALSVLSLSLGILLWHLATTYKFDFYINFENVPSPGKVFQRLFGHISVNGISTSISACRCSAS
ncbi:hypothetical protein QW131_32230 [Roseibium salinum]|nr:hypothetical protein [Roseibium salinum]